MEEGSPPDGPPAWVLAFGPFLAVGVLFAGAFSALSTLEFERLAVSGTVDVLLALTGIGVVAGILPVGVGMLWFPYVRLLEPKWIHAVLAFSAGLIAFIAVEMLAEIVDYASAVPTPLLGEGVAVAGVLGTVAIMEAVSRWRRARTGPTSREGLRVAYLVAVGLGIHSVGEGLAIGSAFVLGQTDLVVLLTAGFVMHNVTEGPAVISAVARDAESPPVRHFALLGVLAGGGVVLGGWLGGFVDSVLLATACYAVAFGAIVQVLWEMHGLILDDAGELFTARTSAAFAAGAAVMFFLEVVVVGQWLFG